jgi:hypothetical protein
LNLRYFEELKTSNHPHFKKLREATKHNKVKIVSSVEEGLNLVSTGNYIFPIQEDSLAAYSAKERCDLTYVSNAITMKSAHFVFRQNSTFIEPFNKAIRSNLGFVRRTFEKYFKNNFKTTKKRKKCPSSGKKTLTNNQKALSKLIFDIRRLITIFRYNFSVRSNCRLRNWANSVFNCICYGVLCLMAA